jgi:hypothetical protein
MSGEISMGMHAWMLGIMGFSCHYPATAYLKIAFTMNTGMPVISFLAPGPLKLPGISSRPCRSLADRITAGELVIRPGR